ncbi:hypothetical protein [uncultured Lacinutrix sp.]|uniref:hypothetical protein n=1 Tax=uncultured Lacinutrix sp. TaxID=574032 RepID=UPI00260A1E2D|nr:hypothetical protein [uncultured Lacinutrix sp.]
MKKLIFILSCFAFCSFSYAQQTYTIGDKTIVLKTEVEGSLDLLWNSIDGQFRYFIKTKDDALLELKNTKGSNNKFQEEYKQTLSDLTQMDASKVKLTTYSLKVFIDNYNVSKDVNYTTTNTKSNLKLRLGIFGGLTNNPFVKNPNSTINTDSEAVPFLGAELEVVSDKITRHSGFLNLRYTASNDAFEYSSTQLALGYRYRVIHKEAFNIYAQTKFATLTNAKTTTRFIDPNDATNIIVSENSGTTFDVPLIFGIGADIKLGNGYLTFVYDSLFAILIDNEAGFPIDLAIGYKFNL